MPDKPTSESAKTVTVRLGPTQAEALEYVKGRLAEESGEDYTDEQAMRIALIATETVANTEKFAEVVREALATTGPLAQK
jgi:hypothetical protein